MIDIGVCVCVCTSMCVALFGYHAVWMEVREEPWVFVFTVILFETGSLVSYCLCPASRPVNCGKCSRPCLLSSHRTYIHMYDFMPDSTQVWGIRTQVYPQRQRALYLLSHPLGSTSLSKLIYPM